MDGRPLQELWFVSNIVDGDKIFPVAGKEAATASRFVRGMNPLEVKEAIEVGLRMLGYHQLKTFNYRPISFGQFPGYRFEFSYALESGLENQGLVLATTKDNKLFLIMYTGTRLYYFDKHKDSVEQIIGSIHFL